MSSCYSLANIIVKSNPPAQLNLYLPYFSIYLTIIPYCPVGKIAEKTVCRSATHSSRLFFGNFAHWARINFRDFCKCYLNSQTF